MKKYLVLLAMLLPNFAYAATKSAKAMVVKPTVKVYASHSAKSDVLVVLKKGSLVDVAGVTDDGWAKVKVTVSGFLFDGWVVKSSLGKPTTSEAPRALAAAPAPIISTAAVPPRVVPQSAPTAALKPSSSTQLEQFFEPAGKPAVNQPSESSQQVVESSPREEPKAVVRPKKTKTVSSKSSEDSEKQKWTDDKLVLFASPGYMVHQYTFSDATKDAFRYNLTGLSLIFGADYKAFKLFNDLILLSVAFQGQYAFLNTKTNLLDGTNTKFSDLTAANRVLDLWLKGKLLVNFQRIVDKPFLVGLTFGYEYMKFFSDDIIADDGTPVGLFVAQSTKSFPVGLVTELHFLDPVVMTVGLDLLLKNTTTESPTGSSGSTPNTKTGYEPYLSLNFPLVGPHYMGIRYQYRIQKTTFAGASTSRVNNVLNGAEAVESYHTIGLEYAYHF